MGMMGIWSRTGCTRNLSKIGFSEGVIETQLTRVPKYLIGRSLRTYTTLSLYRKALSSTRKSRLLVLRRYPLAPTASPPTTTCRTPFVRKISDTSRRPSIWVCGTQPVRLSIEQIEQGIDLGVKE